MQTPQPKAGFLLTARLKSKRLPKKITLPVLGKPLLTYMLDRLKAAQRIGTIVVCTSTNPQDDPLEELALENDVECYRGSEEDVLARLLGAAEKYSMDFFVNITADCPLIDPYFADQTVVEFEKTGADLVQFNKLPLGQGPNGVKTGALKKICQRKEKTETEVWGGYFFDSPDYKVHFPDIEQRFIHSTLKTSIDYPEDYQFLQKVFEELYSPDKIFSLLDLLELVKGQPELVEINAHCSALGRDHIKQNATKPSFK